MGVKYLNFDINLKLLYSVSSDLIDALESAIAPEADEEDDTEDIVVYYKAHEFIDNDSSSNP